MNIKKELDRFLLQVQKPGRYVGGELHSVIKDKSQVDLRFAFCFPDLYEIGMSNIAIKILYGLFNEQPGIWCERVFAPWPDMRGQMQSRGIPLYGLESGDPLSDFDFIGFTLQYELSYTNILQMLALGNIPLLQKDRKGLSNIVVGGGPCACNPEPLAVFFDIFFLGEGEEVDLQVMQLYRQCRGENTTREEFLARASHIRGVYVPSLYTVTYHEDGRVQAVTPRCGAPEKIQKCNIMDLDSMYYPKSFVVPFLEVVQDRAVVEVLRGCHRGCRFCQAGFLYRPFREKSVDTLDAQCRALCKNDGYDEITLSSLSTSDYRQLFPLIDRLRSWTDEEKITISLPSLRVDNFTMELADRVGSIRKSSLTFAPEAGTQRMRDVINKNVTEEQLMNTASLAFSNGWSKLKLYFMIGLPTETDEDVQGIVELCQQVINLYYHTPGRNPNSGVSLTASAAAFVPKPFTPFQWFGQDSLETMRRKQQLLVHSINPKNKRHLNVNYHGAETSFLEAVFARGDRRLGKVLLEAQKRGFQFDGWDEYFSFENWMQLFRDLDVDPAFYASRQREFTETLPWDHLDYSVSKAFLQRECEKAYSGVTTPNCTESCSGCGAACYKGGVCVEGNSSVVL